MRKSDPKLQSFSCWQLSTEQRQIPSVLSIREYVARTTCEVNKPERPILFTKQLLVRFVVGVKRRRTKICCTIQSPRLNQPTSQSIPYPSINRAVQASTPFHHAASYASPVKAMTNVDKEKAHRNWMMKRKRRDHFCHASSE